MADFVRASHPVFGTLVIPSTWLTMYPGVWTVLDPDDPGPGPDPLSMYVRDVDLPAQMDAVAADPESAFSVRQRAALAAPAAAQFSRLTTAKTKTDVHNEAGFPALGATTTLHTLTGAGLIRSFQMTFADKNQAKVARVQFFVDGETNPSIDVEFGTLFGAQNDAFTARMVSNEHVYTALNDTTVSAAMTFPIPFTNGLIVKILNPSVVSPPAGTASWMFSVVQYQAGPIAGVTDKWRLRSAGVPFASPLAGVQKVRLPFFEQQNAAGSLVYFAAAVDAATAYTFLERPWNIWVDGEATPGYRGNAEDWWNAGYFFRQLSTMSTPVASVTAVNTAALTFYGGIDLLAMVGGIRFDSSLRMGFGTALETKTQDFDSSDFVMGFAALFYVDVTTVPADAAPAAPAAPVALAASSTSVAVKWGDVQTKPSTPTTGYTVTLSPGGAVATVGGDVLTTTFTGLDQGTTYTATYTATNSVGTSPASAASNTVTTPLVPGAFTDTFNRADAATLGPRWTLAAEGATVPSGSIVGNHAKLAASTAAAGPVFAIADTASATQDATLTVASFGATPAYSGLITRYVDPSNYVVLQYNAISAATGYALYRKVAGAYTQMGATIAVAPADGDVLRIKAVGTAYEVYVNGVLKINVTDAVPSTTATKVAFTVSRTGASQPTTEFDSFVAA